MLAIGLIKKQGRVQCGGGCKWGTSGFVGLYWYDQWRHLTDFTFVVLAEVDPAAGVIRVEGCGQLVMKQRNNMLFDYQAGVHGL